MSAAFRLSASIISNDIVSQYRRDCVRARDRPARTDPKAQLLSTPFTQIDFKWRFISASYRRSHLPMSFTAGLRRVKEVQVIKRFISFSGPYLPTPNYAGLTRECTLIIRRYISRFQTLSRSSQTSNKGVELHRNERRKRVTKLKV